MRDGIFLLLHLKLQLKADDIPAPACTVNLIAEPVDRCGCTKAPFFSVLLLYFNVQWYIIPLLQNNILQLGVNLNLIYLLPYLRIRRVGLGWLGNSSTASGSCNPVNCR